METKRETAKHTPGPWEVLPLPSKSNVWSPSTGAVVASIGGRTHAEGMANEALIAAAPDLLEACKEVLNAIDAFPHGKTTPLGKPNGGIAKMLRAAIAKAEGR